MHAACTGPHMPLVTHARNHLLSPHLKHLHCWGAKLAAYVLPPVCSTQDEPGSPCMAPTPKSHTMLLAPGGLRGTCSEPQAGRPVLPLDRCSECGRRGQSPCSGQIVQPPSHPLIRRIVFLGSYANLYTREAARSPAQRTAKDLVARVVALTRSNRPNWIPQFKLSHAPVRSHVPLSPGPGVRRSCGGRRCAACGAACCIGALFSMDRTHVLQGARVPQVHRCQEDCG